MVVGVAAYGAPRQGGGVGGALYPYDYYGRLWVCMWLYGYVCGSVGTYVALWVRMWLYGYVCGSVGTYVALWVRMWLCVYV